MQAFKTLTLKPQLIELRSAHSFRKDAQQTQPRGRGSVCDKSLEKPNTLYIYEPCALMVLNLAGQWIQSPSCFRLMISCHTAFSTLKLLLMLKKENQGSLRFVDAAFLRNIKLKKKWSDSNINRSLWIQRHATHAPIIMWYLMVHVC